MKKIWINNISIQIFVKIWTRIVSSTKYLTIIIWHAKRSKNFLYFCIFKRNCWKSSLITFRCKLFTQLKETRFTCYLAELWNYKFNLFFDGMSCVLNFFGIWISLGVFFSLRKLIQGSYFWEISRPRIFLSLLGIISHLSRQTISNYYENLLKRY